VGKYKVVFNSYFILLFHPRHQKLINMPYYLLKALHNMAHYARTSRVPVTCLTHHGLINLLIKWVEGLPNELQPEDRVELGNPPRGILEENDEQVEIPQDDQSESTEETWDGVIFESPKPMEEDKGSLGLVQEYDSSYEATEMKTVEDDNGEKEEESSAMRDDYSKNLPHKETIQILENPCIDDLQSYIVIEEEPAPSAQRKRKSIAFVSTFPRRRTRAAKEARLKTINIEILVLHPLSPLCRNSDTVTVTQEPVNNPAKENDGVTVTEEQVNNIGMEENDVNVGHNLASANTQEPATENEEEGQRQKQEDGSQIATLVAENEMLREEIRHPQLELEVVKRAKMEACTLSVLSRATEVVGKSKDETKFGYEEYMCKECGDLYTGAGYQVIQVPRDTITQEPVSIVMQSESVVAATQEPSFKTMNQETQNENPSEFLDAITQTDAPCEPVDEAIQTEPWLMAAKAAKWKQQALLVKAGMIPLTTHERTVQQLRESWAQELTTWNQKWEYL
jgi:hypothetical protein